MNSALPTYRRTLRRRAIVSVCRRMREARGLCDAQGKLVESHSQLELSSEYAYNIEFN